MIVTPPSFTPLVVAVEHDAPHTFLFRGAELLVRRADLALPGARACEALGIEAASLLPVGLLAGIFCRAAWLPAETEAPDGYEFTGLRSLFGRVDEGLIAVAGRASQIAHWHRTHRYCGLCGQRARELPGERAMQCPGCGHIAYPRVSPAMMVLVKKGCAILLARHVRGTGRFTALAGFVEPGESVEEAVHREVREEVGLEVKNLRYFASQSWPFPHSLMLAFTAEHARGEIVTESAEIAEARWFAPGEVPSELSVTQSIARALIEANLAPP